MWINGLAEDIPTILYGRTSGGPLVDHGISTRESAGRVQIKYRQGGDRRPVFMELNKIMEVYK